MKILLLPALLILTVGCAERRRKVEMPRGRTPQVGLIDTVYQVLDQKSRKRVGFVDKTSYDSGRVIYWVTGPDHGERLGYVLPNNSAYKYSWDLGRRSAEAEFIGADVMSFNVRRILGYDHVVVLEAIDMKTLAKETSSGRYETQAAKTPEPAAEEEE